jgi:mannitol-specific phosphotransferase system IIBC component
LSKTQNGSVTKGEKKKQKKLKEIKITHSAKGRVPKKSHLSRVGKRKRKDKKKKTYAFKKWVVIREFIPANHAQLFSKQFGQFEIQNWVGLKETIHA